MADFDEIIRMVAKAHNSTPETVLKELQASICLAHHNADPTVRANWEAAGMSDPPTVEDFVYRVAAMVKQQLDHDSLH